MHHLIAPERLPYYSDGMREVVQFIEVNNQREFTRQDVVHHVLTRPMAVTRHLNSLEIQGRIEATTSDGPTYRVVGEETVHEEDIITRVVDEWSDKGGRNDQFFLVESRIPAKVFWPVWGDLLRDGKVVEVPDPHGWSDYVSPSAFADLAQQRADLQQQASDEQQKRESRKQAMEAILGLFWPAGVPVRDLDQAQQARQEFARVVGRLGLEVPPT